MATNILAVLRILRSDQSAKALIEVEVPEAKRDEFDGNYRRATGELATPGNFYHVIDNKWGVELRLYLAASQNTIQELSNHCSVTANSGIHSDEYSHRINDNDLIRGMFRDGYRLGPNTPKDL